LLHILGYDHEDVEDESVMFALQETIVSEWEEMQ
jgi:ssRNA-specific RNase YbeY (16S rRNA maturation enzyme)